MPKKVYRLISPDRLNLPEDKIFHVLWHKQGYRMEIRESEYIGFPKEFVETNPILFAKMEKLTEIPSKPKRPRVHEGVCGDES